MFLEKNLSFSFIKPCSSLLLRTEPRYQWHGSAFQAQVLHHAQLCLTGGAGQCFRISKPTGEAFAATFNTDTDYKDGIHLRADASYCCPFEGSLSCKVVVRQQRSILIVYTAWKQLQNKCKQMFGKEKWPILCNK